MRDGTYLRKLKPAELKAIKRDPNGYAPSKRVISLLLGHIEVIELEMRGVVRLARKAKRYLTQARALVGPKGTQT